MLSQMSCVDACLFTRKSSMRNVPSTTESFGNGIALFSACVQVVAGGMGQELDGRRLSSVAAAVVGGGSVASDCRSPPRGWLISFVLPQVGTERRA